MFSYLISYDLGVPETSESYKTIINKIKSYGIWAKPLKSVWIIKTDLSIAEVRDSLASLAGANDKILVIDVSKTGWATYNVLRAVTTWMQTHL